MIINKFKNCKYQPYIVIPTNFSFILNDYLTERIDNILLEAKRNKCPVFLSASIDGKYCESNRPLKLYNSNNRNDFIVLRSSKEKDPRDDEFYNKVFAFAKKWNFGFHPMIYSRHIEKWKDNFLWFQNMLKKYNIPSHYIYLLEVRNREWNNNSILKFREFIDFLIKWTYNFVNKDPNKFLFYLFRKRGFNILNSPFCEIGRGLGCSIQGTLMIRLGDLAIVPCHRNSYSHQITAKFRIKNNKIIGIEARNLELMIGVYSFDGNVLPICEQCLFKYLCNKGCLGSQLETTGDMFSPIPTVCKLEVNKIYQMLKTYNNLGLLEIIKRFISPRKRKSIELIESVFPFQHKDQIIANIQMQRGKLFKGEDALGYFVPVQRCT